MHPARKKLRYVESAVAALLKQNKFKKDKLTWRKEKAGRVYIFNLQLYSKTQKIPDLSHGDEWVRSFYSLGFWYPKGRGLEALRVQTPPFRVRVGALPALC